MALPSFRRSAQHGGFLLEALIAILVFSFGILGIVGLQARSMRHIGDAQYRAEAAYHASSLIAEMWGQPAAGLPAAYDSTGSGAGYKAFKTRVTAAGSGLPQAKAPDVIFDANPPSVNSQVVTITVYWIEPGETGAPKLEHNYRTTAVVGGNS